MPRHPETGVTAGTLGQPSSLAFRRSMSVQISIDDKGFHATPGEAGGRVWGLGRGADARSVKEPTDSRAHIPAADAHPDPDPDAHAHAGVRRPTRAGADSSTPSRPNSLAPVEGVGRQAVQAVRLNEVAAR